MIKDIPRIRLADVKDDAVQGLLQTSKPLHRMFHMDIDNAEWKPHGIASTLKLDMIISPTMQGWGRIAHGGGIDFVLHDIAGLASLLFARSENPKQVVLGSEMKASYHRPLPIGSKVEIFAAIEQVSGNRITTSSIIRPIGSVDMDGNHYSRALLKTLMVSEIRTPREVV